MSDTIAAPKRFRVAAPAYFTVGGNRYPMDDIVLGDVLIVAAEEEVDEEGDIVGVLERTDNVEPIAVAVLERLPS